MDHWQTLDDVFAGYSMAAFLVIFRYVRMVEGWDMEDVGIWLSGFVASIDWPDVVGGVIVGWVVATLQWRRRVKFLQKQLELSEEQTEMQREALDLEKRRQRDEQAIGPIHWNIHGLEARGPDGE